jgi:hypothetical protein
MDLLAAIADNPTAIPLWMTLLIAVGMYPVGFMLGATCSPCCSAPCALCTEGDLPDTITVTFSDWPDLEPGDYLCTLEFEACFGSDAAATVTAPGETPGPIAAVFLDSGGSGYAVYGREEPTVTATLDGPSTDPPEFSVSLAESTDTCGRPIWTVSAVTVTAPGDGVADGTPVVFTVAEGDSEGETATGFVQTGRSAPDITLGVSDSAGTGAMLTPTVTANGTTPQTWGVSAVTVDDGGSGYTEDEYLTVTLGEGDEAVEDYGLAAYVLTNRLEPDVEAQEFGSGTGAEIAVGVSEITHDGRPAWEVDSLTIANGGSGYEVGEFSQLLAVDDGTTVEAGFAEVTSVDGNGAITGISVYTPGVFYKTTGVIESVVVDFAGRYYKVDGSAASVVVENGGAYWRDNADLPAIVADVTVSVVQTAPSDGSGASFSAEIDDDTSSPTFGQITTVTIDDGGDDYLAYELVKKMCCGVQLNDIPIVLKRTPGACTYSHDICGGWAEPERQIGGTTINTIRSKIEIDVEYRGPDLPPTVSASSLSCDIEMESESLLADCSDFNFSASGINGATVVVAAGGEYDPHFIGRHGSREGAINNCRWCCQGAEDIPEEITVTVSQSAQAPNGNAVPNVAGDYVLSIVDTESLGFKSDLLSWMYGSIGFGDFAIEIRIKPGDCWRYKTYPPLEYPNLVPQCGQCIEGCELRAAATFSQGHPLEPWQSDNCLLNLTTQEELNDAWCPTFCRPTPFCQPASGETFDFLRVGFCGEATFLTITVQ